MLGKAKREFGRPYREDWEGLGHRQLNAPQMRFQGNLFTTSRDPAMTSRPKSLGLGISSLYAHQNFSQRGMHFAFLDILATQALNKRMSQRILRLTTRRLQNSSKQRNVKMS